jgi:tRNA pseudouridine55 synthase
MVSAVRVGGRRLHQLAREGVEVERPARPVTVHRFDVTDVTGCLPPAGSLGFWPAEGVEKRRVSQAGTGVGTDGAPAGPVLRIEVDCSSGTYVRVLAADLGRALGGGAHLRGLRRSAVGPFTVARARPVDDLELLPPLAAVSHLDRVAVDDEVAALVVTGTRLRRSGEAVRFEGDGPWALTSARGGDLLAVYKAVGERAHPAVVLAQG